LRNDPGGLLNGAVGVSAAFLPRGVPVVSTDAAPKTPSANSSPRRRIIFAATARTI